MTDGELFPEALARNVDHVLRVEEHASRTRGFAETVGEWIGRSVGTITFAAVHMLVFGGWMLVNAMVRGAPDPYPFNLLSTVTSCEAVVLAAFVLMTQNRMSSMADRRDHLDLQVNLAVEQETSMIIQMLDRIGRKLDIPPEAGEAAMALSRTATLERLVEELHERFPDSQGELPKA